MDSGATHSFVSTLNQCLQPLESNMVVVTLGGEELLSSQWFPEVAVEVLDRCLPADLRVLKMHDFDVIFGIDWISRHHTHLDYFERRVMFFLVGEREFSF